MLAAASRTARLAGRSPGCGRPTALRTRHRRLGRYLNLRRLRRRFRCLWRFRCRPGLAHRLGRPRRLGRDGQPRPWVRPRARLPACGRRPPNPRPTSHPESSQPQARFALPPAPPVAGSAGPGPPLAAAGADAVSSATSVAREARCPPRATWLTAIHRVASPLFPPLQHCIALVSAITHDGKSIVFLFEDSPLSLRSLPLFDIMF